MFQNCSNLNYIKAMFTTAISSSYTDSWLVDVSSTGTFVKNNVATWDTDYIPQIWRCGNGVPENWTLENASA